ncbi:hypothetical protein ACFL2P_00610, partial [Candidatus Moduliflexota bacterium]
MAAVLVFPSCTGEERGEVTEKINIEIVSCLVRDRVIPLDRLEMRSTVIVGFRITPSMEHNNTLSVRGRLLLDGKVVSEDGIGVLDGPAGNLGFGAHTWSGDFERDKPYVLPDGKYTVEISLLDAKKRAVADVQKEYGRDEIARTYQDPSGNFRKFQFVEEAFPEGLPAEAGKEKEFFCRPGKSFVLFKAGTVERIHHHTIPEPAQCLDSISLDLSRNEHRSFHFGLRALRDLGRVSVSVENLKGKKGTLEVEVLTIGAVGELPEIVALDKAKRVVRYSHGP